MYRRRGRKGRESDRRIEELGGGEEKGVIGRMEESEEIANTCTCLVSS